MTSVHELEEQIREEARRYADDSPRRPLRVRLPSFLVAAIAIFGAALFWLFLWSNRNGPFSTIDHNFDDDWVCVEDFERQTIVLADGRRFRYSAATPLPEGLSALRPSRSRVQYADGTMGEWQDSELGYYVAVGSSDADTVEITVWHSPSFPYAPVRRTWNPFEDAYEVWKVHHTATVQACDVGGE